MGLSIDQFLGIRVLRLEVGDHRLVEISGKNGAGKSSVLKGISAVLAGIFPPEAIRFGSKKSKVCLTLGNQVVPDGSPEVAYRCELTITPSGARLDVTDAQNQPIKNPRAWLRERFAAQGCDPLAFSMMPPREQVEILKRVTGLAEKFSEIQHRKENALANLRDAKRAIQTAEDHVRSNPDVPGPDEEISIGELASRLSAATAKNAENAERRRRFGEYASRLAGMEREIADIEAQIQALERRRDELRNKHHEGCLWLDREKQAIESLRDEDTVSIQESIRDIERHNDAARRRKAHRAALMALRAAQVAEARAAQEVEDLDRKRAAVLASASLPVDGLEFDEEGVRLNGVPIRQANTAAQIRCGVALALAEGRPIRVLMTEFGSMLDADGIRALESIAREHNAQVFVEVTANGPGRGIYIEDGTVKDGNEP